MFKELFPGLPLMALTATATPRVQHDVRLQLRIPRCITFKSSFNRPNLRRAVSRLCHHCLSGSVFVTSRSLRVLMMSLFWACSLQPTATALPYASRAHYSLLPMRTVQAHIW